MLKYFQLIVLGILLPLQILAAPNLADADKAYRQKDYAAALHAYEYQLQQADSTEGGGDALKAELYYNIGNCHYRMKNQGLAVLNYQRALRIDPSNEDAAFNLELTRAKIVDRFDAPSQMFFVSWFNTLVQSQSSGSWTLWALCFMALTVSMVVLYLLSGQITIRKCGFFGAAFSILLTVSCEVFAYIQHSRYERLQQAVVLQTLNTYDTPSIGSKQQYTLHEGTTITIVDSYKDGWIQVELPDEKVTWIKAQGIAKI